MKSSLSPLFVLLCLVVGILATPSEDGAPQALSNKDAASGSPILTQLERDATSVLTRMLESNRREDDGVAFSYSLNTDRQGRAMLSPNYDFTIPPRRAKENETPSRSLTIDTAALPRHTAPLSPLDTLAAVSTHPENYTAGQANFLPVSSARTASPEERFSSQRIWEEEGENAPVHAHNTRTASGRMQRARYSHHRYLRPPKDLKVAESTAPLSQSDKAGSRPVELPPALQKHHTIHGPHHHHVIRRPQHHHHHYNLGGTHHHHHHYYCVAGRHCHAKHTPAENADNAQDALLTTLGPRLRAAALSLRPIVRDSSSLKDDSAEDADDECTMKVEE